MKRAVAIACTLLIAATAPLPSSHFESDFRYAVEQIASTYAYFDVKATRWRDIPALYKADLTAVRDKREFVRLMEHVVDELYDPHAQLNTNTPTSYRLVPSGTDLWAEWRDAKAFVVDVRAGSDAAAALHPGDQVLALNGVAIEQAVDARMGRSYPHSTAAARDWALRSVLAGTHGAARELEVSRAGVRRKVKLDARDQYPAPARSPVTSSLLPSGIGYIRFNDSLGDIATIGAVEEALARLRDAPALILDLRDTPSGGNTSVARGILGRFVTREVAYQKHVLPSEERDTGVRRSWLELVTPRGDFQFGRPIAVLVGHWTGSMGEGMAIGLDATTQCQTFGTAMAGLRGATYTITLPNTGIAMNLPAERLYHVNGTPREAFAPTHLVEPAEDPGVTDPALEAATKALTTR